MRRRFLPALVAALVLALGIPATASAVRLQLVAGSFDQLTQVTAPRSGDPSGTLYVVEQEGQVYKLQGGTRTLFLDIRSLVSCCGERGLLGIAFDPQFATNDLLYVNYTNVRGDTRVARYRANASHTGVASQHPAAAVRPRPARVEPQRRPAPVRPERQAVHGPGRRGRKLRPRRARAEPAQPPREAPQPESPQHRRRLADRRVRPAEPVGVLLRPRQRAPVHR